MNIIETFRCCGMIAKTIIRNAFRIKLEPEVHVLSRFLPPGSVCFDIGAAYGRYALSMSKCAGDSGKIYCFEPADYSHSVLSAIVRFYGLKNVVIIKKALSNQEGSGVLAAPIKRQSKIIPGPAYSLAHLATQTEENSIHHSVSVTTIDQFMSASQTAKLDFIKCDVEGAELLVFEGGKQAIARYKPTVLCEVYKTWLKRFGTAPERIHSFFTSLGYQAFVLDHGNFFAVNSLDEDRNYFFVPPEQFKIFGSATF